MPLHNEAASLPAQLLGIGSIFLWVFLLSGVAWLGIRASIGLRVSEQHEYAGVDLSECGLEAYPEFTRAD